MGIDTIGLSLAALLTPLIALLAAYIAWQQWKTNERKLKLDLYDRRFRIYEATRQLILSIIRNADVESEEIQKFQLTVAEARFLFGSDITGYLEEIQSRAIQFRSCNGQYRDLYQPKPEGYDHHEVVAKIHTELVWLAGQLEPTAQKFGEYLKIK